MNQCVDSYYEASVQRPPPHPPLTAELSADVCVIGGGFTGLSCALELARKGRRVVLLEAECIGWGASGRSGGQALVGYSRSNLYKPAADAGVSEKYLFDLTAEAVNLVRVRIAEFNIDCDFRQGTMLAALNASHCREINEYADTLVNQYNYSVQVLDLSDTRAAIASRRYCGALIDDNSGHLHPLKYVLGLARAAADAGVIIYENTPAQSLTETNSGASIKTENGLVKCAQAVYAGNAYIDLDKKLRARVMPVGTYIGATKPLSAAAADNLIAERRAVCDMNFVLDYFRCSADHRLLFGGRVSYTNHTPKNLYHLIHDRMAKVFPQIAEQTLEYTWGGSVAITASRFPDWGRRGNAVYYAQGFSGHGVALSGFAGKIIADAIAGDSEILDIFGRVPHANFIGGPVLRTPLLALAMMYYRMRDLLG